MLNKEQNDNFELALRRIIDASKKDIVAGNKAAFLLYLQEEVGEVAECIEVEMGMKNRKTKESLEDECVDVVIAALGNYFNAGGDLDNLFDVMKKKSKKWLDRTNSNKPKKFTYHFSRTNTPNEVVFKGVTVEKGRNKNDDIFLDHDESIISI